MEYLYMLQQALVWIITIYWLYQLMVSICSLVKLKDKPIIEEKNNKFMAIIPAHNEEIVVGNLIASLQKQNYPKDLYDIYVIADNCTDNTAEVARKAGAIVYERFDEEHKTKGYALDWFLKQKIEENAPYDAFCIFDADNIVDVDFLKNMNKKLCQGEEVVQGYRDIKNPTDSWVSAGYAIFYWTMNRFYHLARYNLGLSPLINGTGFMVKFDLVKPTNGFDTVTLTEDIEFSLKTIISGKKLGWATDAIVYDEQPVGFKQSWSQRSRWTVGHIQCLKEYTKPLAAAVKEHKTLMNFDGLLYMLGSIPMFVLTIVLLLLNFVMYFGNGMTTTDLIINCLRYLLPTFLLPIFTAIIIMILDKKPIKPMLKGLALYPLFLGSWLLINFKCLFKRETKWEKINHVRDIKINEVS
ncbi:MAG: glycosyltransferase family 2 protein [Clostridia bacterium]|jgi:cellulose synthase/poly-beta-1,6-N-acetylglucosamine synthase-like glycosyltransferase|nr:n-acetylglucosaminyltransferase [Clostridium sp. CAG:571]HJJ06065.1 glycosyltransferase family 2 protein [Clostridiaceae bacterium]HJJ14467.1 glycosyltransferase family 2 protein [Clostridiaceae bacterium]